MSEKKRTLSEICEELCPGVTERNRGAFTRDPTLCYHGLKLGTCGSPLCEGATAPPAPHERGYC